MEQKIKNKCPKFKLELYNYLEIICNFTRDTIDDAKQKVINYSYIDKQSDKQLWALFGKDSEDTDWVCLEVGSSNNIKKEISENLNLMYKKPQKVWKNSEFHKNEELFEFYTYYDRASCKYRKIAQICTQFCWCELDVRKYLENSTHLKKNRKWTW